MSANRWVVNGLLGVILALLLAFYFNSSIGTAHAAGGGWDTNGVMAMTTAGEHMVLIDTAKQNIMIYRAQGLGKFRLVGARSYKYDIEAGDTSGRGGYSIVESRGITFGEAYTLYQQAKLH